MNILILLPNNFEDIELMTPVDIWRRANYSVTIASINNDLKVTSQQGVNLLADTLLENVDLTNMDCLFLPGGVGHKLLAEDPSVTTTIQHFVESKKKILAICAAPTILVRWLQDKKATCYPSLKDKLPLYLNQKTVVDLPFITSQGAGTASDLALTLVTLTDGESTSITLKQQLLFHL